MRWAFFTAGDERMASSRLRAFLPGAALRARGHHVEFNPSPELCHVDVVVVQKRGDLTRYYRLWQGRGALVVFDCDDMYEWARVAAAGANLVTVDTPYKRRLFHGAEIVPDVLDVGPVYEAKHAHRDKLEEAVWFGHPDNLCHLDHAANACFRCGIALSVITDTAHPAFRAWDQHVTGFGWSGDSIDEELIRYDLAVLPYRYDTQWGMDWVKAKSANRVYKAWALGLPVAATPIPSYVDAGVRYLASTVEEWVSALMLLQDRKAREQDAGFGLRQALQFTPDRVAATWEEVARYAPERKWS